MITDNQQHSPRIEKLRAVLPEKILVVLTKEPDLKTNIINIQDYLMNGEMVIPVFSSLEDFKASVGKENLGKPVWGIARSVFARVVREHQIFLLNPRLASEMRFTGKEFAEAFPT